DRTRAGRAMRAMPSTTTEPSPVADVTGGVVVVHAASPAAPHPPAVQLPSGTPDSVGDVLALAFARSTDRLLGEDAAVRHGGDPQAVHRARVATRRLRSDLRTYRGIVDPAWAGALRDELRWLGDLLGGVRDLDVLREGMVGLGVSIPLEDRV